MSSSTRAAWVALGLLAMCADPAPARDGGQTPKAVVLAFYKLALSDFKPEDAFARYATADFVDHAPDVPGGGRKDAAAALRGLFAQMPKGRWTIVRSAAEGDLVFLHVRVDPAPGAPPVAIAEIFRVKGHRIVEHWDVVRPTPEKPENARSMF
jgi:predicted SnoaL-like aldol condensation-catalyzing enzyme